MTHPILQCFTPIITAVLLALSNLAHGDALDNIRERGMLRVGVSSHRPPFSTLKPDDTFVGFEVSLAGALAERLEVALVLQPVPALAHTTLLHRQKVDLLIAALVNTPHHQDRVTLVVPGYYASGTRALAPLDTAVDTWSSLSEIPICGVQGSLALRYSRQQVNFQFLGMATTPAALSALRQHQCQALIHDESVLLSILQEPFWKTHYTLALRPLGVTPWHLGILPEEPRWANWLSATLAQWHRDGTLLQLAEAAQLPPSNYLRTMHISYRRTSPHP